MVEARFSDSRELSLSGVVSSQGVKLDVVMEDVLEDDEGDRGEGDKEFLLEGVIRMLFVFVGVLRPMSIAMQAVSDGEVLRVAHSGVTSSFGSTMIVVICAVAEAPLDGVMLRIGEPRWGMPSNKYSVAIFNRGG